MRRAAAAACLVSLLGSACADDPGVERRTTEPVRAIRFDADDGVELAGDLRGRGPAGIVLAHAFPTDRRSWADFAALLVDEGYLVLNFDFRGYGESEGARDFAEMWRDVLAAVEALRIEGAERVALVGSSMGGTAALVAASRAEVDAVVALSSPATFRGLVALDDVVGAVEEPKLFVAAQDDGTAAATAQAFHEQAMGEKRIEIVTGSDHGTQLLLGDQAELVRDELLRFLHAHMPPG